MTKQLNDLTTEKVTTTLNFERNPLNGSKHSKTTGPVFRLELKELVISTANSDSNGRIPSWHTPTCPETSGLVPKSQKGSFETVFVLKVRSEA